MNYREILRNVSKELEAAESHVGMIKRDLGALRDKARPKKDIGPVTAGRILEAVAEEADILIGQLNPLSTNLGHLGRDSKLAAERDPGEDGLSLQQIEKRRALKEEIRKEGENE